MNSLLRIGVALGIFLLLPVPPTEAAGPPGYGEAEVRERLDFLKVDTSDIRDIIYEAQRRSSSDNDQIVRILAWVSLHSCKGYVIINLSQQCTVRQTYGRGGCTLVHCNRNSGRGC